MTPQLKQKTRKKVNFMIDKNLLERLEDLVPAGERSDFMNEALEEAIIDFGIKKANELIEKSKAKEKKYHTTKEILKIIHEGRRY